MIKTINYGLDGYSIFQMTNQGVSQMMSYLITTPEGKLVVIDGGTSNETESLRKKIKECGGIVDSWLLTHAHSDHIDAVINILNDLGDITVKKIYYNFPPRDWLINAESEYVGSVDRFFSVIKRFDDICIKTAEGMNIVAGNLKIEVLTDPSNYYEYSDFNSTTVVYRFVFPHATALFLGDLSEKAGISFVEKYGDTLRSDIVQMAHHGQNGVSKDVYEKIAPKVCLWPTPKWLWDNDSGRGRNSGPWATLITREWMEELGVKIHAPIFEGEYKVI